MVYFLALFYSYFLIFFARKLPLAILWGLCLPFMFLSMFRGGAGKDTVLYLKRFYANGEFNESCVFTVEPMLNWLICLSKFGLGGGHVLFFLLNSMVVCFGFSVAIKNYHQFRAYLLTVGPMFLVDGLTNGMRVALAYHIFLISIAYRSKLVGPILVLFSHVSGFVMLIVRYVVDNVKLRSVRGVVFLVSLVFMLVISSVLIGKYENQLSLLFPRLFNKFDQYSTLTLSTKYSGVADLFVLFCLVFYLRFIGSGRLFVRGGVALIYALVCAGVMYVCIQQSLAFIRVVKLILVGLLCSGLLASKMRRVPLFLLLPIGVLYSLNFVRQVLFGHGFLPYPGEVLW